VLTINSFDLLILENSHVNAYHRIHMLMNENCICCLTIVAGPCQINYMPRIYPFECPFDRMISKNHEFIMLIWLYLWLYLLKNQQKKYQLHFLQKCEIWVKVDPIEWIFRCVEHRHNRLYPSAFIKMH
jgi:hypothetical protein